MIDNFIYTFWTLINVTHDGFYKYHSFDGTKTIFCRYTLVFIFSILWLIYEIFGKKQRMCLAKVGQIFLLSLSRSLSTFVALIFNLLQLEQGSIVNTTVIFYSIVYFDYFFANFFQLPKNNHIKWNNFYLFMVISLYYFMHFDYICYLYGYLSSFFFSLSNNFFLVGKKMNLGHKNNFFFSLDLNFFSFGIILCSLFYFKNSFISIFSHEMKGENFNLLVLSALGLIITLLLYFLFSREDYSPSHKMANFDILIGAIFDKLLFNVYPGPINLFLILNILC